ncbi:DUF3429 domain-containing protein [Pseudaestuariivita rosea]|uniref:DUF3429 domain-containing protein n=1 Tax=Pseudaestuariivita rosea TaxID=2763263 RepID=UPI001ABB24BB|nr:DUF3429 domain-containing protein [Pseudaestuariivita rosea]
MISIPRSALLLGLAGLIPFVWGVLTTIFPSLWHMSFDTLGPRFVGPFIQISYGTIILAFMSGVLWGFATKTTGTQAAIGYALSVIPALWAFFFVGGGPVSASIYLIFGFIGLLGLDWQFWRNNLAPPWWMQLRVMLTVVVIGCLGIELI